MAHLCTCTTLRYRAIAILITLCALSIGPALAENGTNEHAQLAALVRHLDMIDRLTKHSASLPHPDGSRYHFDYARLHEDIERVRQGIRDYLAPQRAQPRDPVELFGDYRLVSEEAAP